MTSSFPSLPEPLRKFFAYFPLHTYPPNDTTSLASKSRSSPPTIYIFPPRDPSSSSLSNDVECLKWQAYLALRNVPRLTVRWNIAPEGGVNGRLPMLAMKEDLLGAEMIPGWADGILGTDGGVLEGYMDETTRDESRAWVSLLEGNVHAALILSQPPQSILTSLLFAPTTDPLQSIVTPPPAPLTGISSLLPPRGTHISKTAVQLKYAEAIDALSERLGTDTWFLGSPAPTALDALLFAYLHCILTGRDSVRFDATRRVNLVAWERRVRGTVQATFPAVHPHA